MQALREGWPRCSGCGSSFRKRGYGRTYRPEPDGAAVVPVEAPDSITTWILRAVGLSKEHGLGIGESQLRVFQPFFLTVDLPFSAIRGEELPVKVALFNYLGPRHKRCSWK